MRRRDLVRHLKSHGCELLREGGEHSVYVNRRARKASAVPRHRRGLVTIGVPVAVSGLVLGGLAPFGGVTADAAIFLFGALFLVALSRGFLAARRRAFEIHREWMLRAGAIGAGIATVRVVAVPLYWLVGGSALALVGPTFWLGLGLSAAVAEWWIWYSRRRGYTTSVLPN